MPLGFIALILVLACVSAVYFYRFYSKHMQGENSPTLTIDIRILDKQSVPVPDAEPHEDGEEYWIYVEPLDGGPKREFQVGVHYYHALHPGDCGTLTYRGNQFMHFAKLQPTK